MGQDVITVELSSSVLVNIYTHFSLLSTYLISQTWVAIFTLCRLIEYSVLSCSYLGVIGYKINEGGRNSAKGN